MKIHCDSDCRPCVFEGGPSRNLNDQDNAFFCTTCRSTFFCDIGIVRRFTGENIVNSFCVDCSTQLIKKPLDQIALEKAKFLMDNKKLSLSGKFRPTLAARKVIRPVELSMLYDTKTTSAFHTSLIKEMTRISGLNPQVISNFAKDFGIGENVISTLSGDAETTLLTLASVSPKFIEVLHSILIGRDPSVPGGLALRFSVFSHNIANIVFIQPTTSIIESGPYDLLGYDNNGMMIWIFCVQGIVDIKDLEKIVGPMLNQDLSVFSGVSEISIVSQKGFSWGAKQILRKYRGIVVTENDKQRLIPFGLWKEKTMQSSPEISFENIRL